MPASPVAGRRPEDPTLAAIGISRTIAWSLVLGVATFVVAALPVPVLNVPAAVAVAICAVVAAVVGLVRGPRTTWAVVVAIIGIALSIGGVASAFPIALAYIGDGVATSGPVMAVLAASVP